MTRVRTTVLTTTAALAAAVVIFAFWTLPPKARHLPPPAWTPPPTAVDGAYHIHTVHSDGSGTIRQVAAAAARVGLRFAIITDHGGGTRILPPAYHSGVLCIDAVEISTTGGHYVALGLAPTPYPLGGEPRDVVADVARLGGFGIVAHPYSPKRALRWTSWNLPFNGIEWMNADSERRQRTPWQIATALTHYPFRPAETLASLFKRPIRSLARWDSLTEARRVVGLAGADAHARVGWGGTEEQGGTTLARLPSYQASFGAFSIHAEIARPLTGDAVEDTRTILAAIEAGHVYTSIDGLAHPAAFTFTARSGANEADEGDDLVLDGPVTLRARVNDPTATLVLFRNGIPIARAGGGTLTFHAPAEPAVFRVEAHLPGEPRPLPVPWIVSNPVYVLTSPRTPLPPPPPLPVIASEALPGTGPDRWHTERAPGSTVTVASAAAPGGPAAVQIDFRLAGGERNGQYVAAVRPAPSDIAFYDRLAFRAHASRPLRMSMQLRDTSGRRWLRSVYVGPDSRSIVVPFTDLRPVDPASTPSPDLDHVRSVIFAVDLTNAHPGASGTIWLSDLRLER